MSVLQAVILGIVQGIAEFLPISSSGHLVLLRQLFQIHEPAMTFDIVVHLGTLAAVIVVFRQDIFSLIKNPFQKMTGLLVVGTVPAVMVGFLFKDAVETVFQQGWLLALAFIFTGVLLWVADRLPQGEKTDKDITYLDAAVIGCMQAIGIPPGVSRSGATITGALFRGLTRESAARFSFLLSIVVIAGAGVLQGVEVIEEPALLTAVGVMPLVFGFIASALSGYLAVRLLLQLIRSCKLRYFSYYVLALALFILTDSFITKIFF